MGIKSIAKRAQYGERLLTLEDEGERALGQLEGLRSMLPALRAAIVADEDMTSQEKSDATAEVDAVIVELVSKVKAFAASL